MPSEPAITVPIFWLLSFLEIYLDKWKQKPISKEALLASLNETDFFFLIFQAKKLIN